MKIILLTFSFLEMNIYSYKTKYSDIINKLNQYWISYPQISMNEEIISTQ